MTRKPFPAFNFADEPSGTMLGALCRDLSKLLVYMAFVALVGDNSGGAAGEKLI
jgi:hypothetical protein